MRFRTGAVLTAITVGGGLIAAVPSYAATGSNTATPPAPNQSYKAVVTSTVDPSPHPATHSTIALTRLGSKVTRPAGEFGLRWLLSYIPDGGTDFVTCQASDPNFHKGDDPNTTPIDYTFSEAAGSSFTLDSTGGNPASPYCGNGTYDLYTDGAVFLPDGTPVQVNTLSGPEALVGTTPAPIPLSALKIAVTAAQQNEGNPGKAGQVAAQRTPGTALDAKVTQTARALAVKTPPKLKPIVLARR